MYAVLAAHVVLVLRIHKVVNRNVVAHALADKGKRVLPKHGYVVVAVDDEQIALQTLYVV